MNEIRYERPEETVSFDDCKYDDLFRTDPLTTMELIVEDLEANKNNLQETEKELKAEKDRRKTEAENKFDIMQKELTSLKDRYDALTESNKGKIQQ